MEHGYTFTLYRNITNRTVIKSMKQVYLHTAGRGGRSTSQTNTNTHTNRHMEKIKKKKKERGSLVSVEGWEGRDENVYPDILMHPCQYSYQILQSSNGDVSTIFLVTWEWVNDFLQDVYGN